MTPRDDSTDARQPAAAEAGRRRFLGQGGRIAVPVAITLVAQPALGTTCFSPSGSLSKNTSAGRGTPITCNGQSPGNYSQQTADGRPANSWGGTGYAPGDLLSRMYPAASYRADFMNGNQTKTLFQVLNLSGQQDPQRFAFHMIGAMLNVGAGRIPGTVLDPAVLRAIWLAIYSGSGTYRVGSQDWNAADVVLYLKTYGIV